MSRILLVLDLDETLVHSTNQPIADREPDVRIFYHYVYVRPGATALLAECRHHYDFAIWSSAGADYVKEIVKLLWSPDWQPPLFQWSAERCTWKRDVEIDELVGTKPLYKLLRRGYDKRRILGIDDSPEKWRTSFGNLVRVQPYFGAVDDDELKLLLSYLLTIKNCENVRALEKRNWRRTF